MSQSSTREMDNLENQGKENKLKILRKMKRETSIDSEKSEEHSSSLIRNKNDDKNEFSTPRKSSLGEVKVHSKDTKKKPAQTEMDGEKPLSSRRNSFRKLSVEESGSYKKERKYSNHEFDGTPDMKNDISLNKHSLKSLNSRRKSSVISDNSTHSSDKNSRVWCDDEIDRETLKHQKIENRKSSTESRNSSVGGKSSRQSSVSLKENLTGSRSSSIESHKSDATHEGKKEDGKQNEKAAKSKKHSLGEVQITPRKSILKQKNSNSIKKNVSESLDELVSERSSSKISRVCCLFSDGL